MNIEGLDSEFERGISLFNRREFYKCHDSIEDVWLQESSDRQAFLQGLIQAAVAFHHYQNNKWGAARSMLKLALNNLSSYPPKFEKFDLLNLVKSLTAWKNALDVALQKSPRPNQIDLVYPTIKHLDGTEKRYTRDNIDSKLENREYS